MTATRQLLCWAFLICCRASDTGPLPGSSDGVPPKSEGEGGPPRPISAGIEASFPHSGGSDPPPLPPRPDGWVSKLRSDVEGGPSQPVSPGSEVSFPHSGGSDLPPLPPRPEGWVSQLPSDVEGGPYHPRDQAKNSGIEADASRSSFFDRPPYSQHLTHRYNTHYFEGLVNPELGFLSRFREVHIGADLDLMPGGKLYRSAKPIDLPDIIDPEAIVADVEDYEGEVLRINELRINLLVDDFPKLKHIINLNTAPFGADTKSLLHKYGIDVDHIPIKDHTVPSHDVIGRAVESIENARLNGRETWMFCGYGNGRTGVITIAYEAYRMLRTYPFLSSSDLKEFVWRRSGWAMADTNIPVLKQMVNSLDDHKIEKRGDFDSVLEFVDRMSPDLRCVKIP